MLRKAMSLQWIKGFRPGTLENIEVEVSHLLYADDTLLCSAEESQLRYPRAILVLFEAVSGLKINLGKSSMYAINDVQDIERLGEVLVCQIGELPTDYLGMPLGARYKSEQIWQKIDRCEMRLAM